MYLGVIMIQMYVCTQDWRAVRINAGGCTPLCAVMHTKKSRTGLACGSQKRVDFLFVRVFVAGLTCQPSDELAKNS